MPRTDTTTGEAYFEPEHLPTPNPESRLYSLEPMGRGGGAIESIRSYLRRLAFAHRVSTNNLMKEVLHPLAIRLLNWEIPGLFGPRFRYVLGGYGNHTAMMVKVLQAATCCPDLQSCTLLPLKGVVGVQRLIPTHRRHCPLCLSKKTTSANYGRLLWEFGCVTACPVHGIELIVSRCGAPPSEHLPQARRVGLDGVCSNCGSIGYACNASTPLATPHAVWEAAQVAALIGRITGGNWAINPAAFRNGIHRAAQIAGQGAVAIGAKRAGIPKSNVCEWVKGHHQPSLDKVLRLCRVAGVSLVSVAEGAPEVVLSPALDGDLPHKTPRRPRPTASERQTALCQGLLEIPPPSLQTVANRVGVDRGTLALNYPELCARLVDAHRCFLEKGAANRKQAALQKMNSAFAMLERQGKTPTVRNLETACGSVLLPTGMLRKTFERTKKTNRQII